MSKTNIPEWRLDRTIRVFVSSTFRDMSAERSCLMETTFPRIQKYCREKNVYFIPLDLRWGITKEQSKSGKVAAYNESINNYEIRCRNHPGIFENELEKIRRYQNEASQKIKLR